jgi:hypothetical protein
MPDDPDSFEGENSGERVDVVIGEPGWATSHGSSPLSRRMRRTRQVRDSPPNRNFAANPSESETIGAS